MFKKIILFFCFIILTNVIQGIYLKDSFQEGLSQELTKNFPVTALIVTNSSDTGASGVLFDTDWIMTSAHADNPIAVVLNGNIYGIDLAIPHPKYFRKFNDPSFDLCLLHLKRSTSIQPIARAINYKQQDSKAWITGFGLRGLSNISGTYLVATNSLDFVENNMIELKSNYDNVNSFLPGIVVHGDSGGGNFVNILQPYNDNPPKDKDDFYDNYRLVSMNTLGDNLNISPGETEEQITEKMQRLTGASLNITDTDLASWINKVVLTNALGDIDQYFQHNVDRLKRSFDKLFAEVSKTDPKSIKNIDTNARSIYSKEINKHAKLPSQIFIKETQKKNINDDAISKNYDSIILVDNQWVLTHTATNFLDRININNQFYNVDQNKVKTYKEIKLCKLKQPVDTILPIRRARLVEKDMDVLEGSLMESIPKMALSKSNFAFEIDTDSKKLFAICNRKGSIDMRNGIVLTKLNLLTPDIMSWIDHVILSDSLQENVSD